MIIIYKNKHNRPVTLNVDGLTVIDNKGDSFEIQLHPKAGIDICSDCKTECVCLISDRELKQFEDTKDAIKRMIENLKI